MKLSKHQVAALIRIRDDMPALARRNTLDSLIRLGLVVTDSDAIIAGERCMFLSPSGERALRAVAGTEEWLRFDLTTGEDRRASVSEVRGACEEMGVAYNAAVIAGHVRYECFDYELVEDDEEDT